MSLSDYNVGWAEAEAKAKRKETALANLKSAKGKRTGRPRLEAPTARALYMRRLRAKKKAQEKN